MQNQDQAPKLFAFKLAKQEEQKTKPQQQWKVRDGVAIAGCTGDDARFHKPTGGTDNGIYC